MTRKTRSSSLLFALVAALSTQSAWAGWGLRNSFGQSIYLVEPKVTPLDASGRLISGCDNALCYDGNRRRPIDFEVMPYYGFGLLSIDLGIVFNVESRTDLGFAFHFRPGIRVFPLLGLYARGYLDLDVDQITTMVSNTGAMKASFEGHLGLGVGYQLKAGPWGAFVEVGVAPRLWGSGVFNMPFEVRLGLLLEPS